MRKLTALRSMLSLCRVVRMMVTAAERCRRIVSARPSSGIYGSKGTQIWSVRKRRKLMGERGVVPWTGLERQIPAMERPAKKFRSRCRGCQDSDSYPERSSPGPPGEWVRCSLLLDWDT